MLQLDIKAGVRHFYHIPHCYRRGHDQEQLPGAGVGVAFNALFGSNKQQLEDVSYTHAFITSAYFEVIPPPGDPQTREQLCTLGTQGGPPLCHPLQHQTCCCGVPQ